MSARVVVVEHYFYYLIMFQDVRICVDPVDGSIVGEFTGGEGSIERWDSGGNIGDLIEERAAISNQLRVCLVAESESILVGSVTKIVHCKVKVERVVDRAEELFTVRWY